MLQEELDRLEEEMQQQLGRSDFNPLKYAELKTVLYAAPPDGLGMPVIKRMQRGSPSVSYPTLLALPDHPVVLLLRRHMEVRHEMRKRAKNG